MINQLTRCTAGPSIAPCGQPHQGSHGQALHGDDKGAELALLTIVDHAGGSALKQFKKRKAAFHVLKDVEESLKSLIPSHVLLKTYYLD